MECSAIRCHQEATMTLDLRTTYEDDFTHEDSIPYCDDDLGWFYRSFSRKSYQTEILGVTILRDLDDTIPI